MQNKPKCMHYAYNYIYCIGKSTFVCKLTSACTHIHTSVGRGINFFYFQYAVLRIHNDIWYPAVFDQVKMKTHKHTYTHVHIHTQLQNYMIMDLDSNEKHIYFHDKSVHTQCLGMQLSTLDECIFVVQVNFQVHVLQPL